MLRGVAGRRALHLGLLLGGLFALGFLCGEQAYAADGAGALPVKSPVRSVTWPNNRPDEPSVVPVGESKVLRPVTEGIAAIVSDGVVRPVGDLVETVTTGLTETVELPPVESLPELPPLPSVPALPEAPVQTLPAPVPAPPATSAPQPGPADHSKAEPADEDEEASTSGRAAHGPRFTGGDSLTGAALLGPRQYASTPHASVPRSGSTAPAHQAPSDHQGGPLSGKPALDNGSSRHCDAHAVTLDHRAALRLVPGVAVDVDAAGTRDIHRDIPVFPG